MNENSPMDDAKPEVSRWADWFREVAPYINKHRESTIVLALAGEAFNERYLQTVLYDIALMKSLGMQLVIVLGARPQIKEALERAGIASHVHQGVRITTREAMEEILRCAGGLRMKLEAELSSGVLDSPLHRASLRMLSGNLITAKPMGVIDGVDFGHSGLVRRVNTDTIQALLNQDYLVLLSNIGFSLTGDAFNLNYQEVAGSVARALNADKLIFLSELGMLRKNGEPIRELGLKQAKDILLGMKKSGTASDARYSGNIAGLRQAKKAAAGGAVKRVHLLDLKQNDTLLEELFTVDGSGTLISDDYDQIRPATIKDVSEVAALLAPLERSGALVKRSIQQLEDNIEHFVVDERDGTITGCAALFIYHPEAQAELASFAVSNFSRKDGRGDLLLAHVERLAREQGVKQLFVLTTQTEHWFRERGFNPCELSALPERKQQNYDRTRMSKTLLKTL